MPDRSDTPVTVASDGKVMVGRDGWLFLDMDSNQVMRQHSGLAGLSKEDLRRWGDLLASRTSRLADAGAGYLLAVAPDAHAVYPEMLPGEVAIARERPVLQLLDHLRAEGSPAKIVYPLDALLREKRHRAVFPKVGTHWNAIGAFIAYETIADEIEKVLPIRRLTWDELRFERWLGVSDLGRKVRPPWVSEIVACRTRDVPRARLVADNCVDNRGALIEFTCPEAPKTSCLMFGDSSAYSLLRFMAESFRTLLFAHTPSVDFDLVRRADWDLVMNVMTERFLIKVPSDSGDSIASLARAKLDEGRIRPPVSFTPLIYVDRRGVAPSEDSTGPARMTVGDVMQAVRADSIDVEASVRAAARRMIELELNAIAIVDGEGRFRGMLTMRTLMEVLAEGSDPDSIRVARFADVQPAIAAGDPLDDAAALMKHNKLQWLAVVDDEGRLAGNVTRAVVDRHARAAATGSRPDDADD